NLVDASNLERNLYLSTQLMEMEVPMLMVLSMVDLATRMGSGLITSIWRRIWDSTCFRWF
ncbi:MAG: FeoB small GTPase domain-containing protein, partial [Candidatus Cloacimonetes bacterium]|nr:FeoB small GTPase domain-containing protein [Candidatus Cloacimonadota bacterium]